MRRQSNEVTPMRLCKKARRVYPVKYLKLAVASFNASPSGDFFRTPVSEHLDDAVAYGVASQIGNRVQA